MQLTAAATAVRAAGILTSRQTDRWTDPDFQLGARASEREAAHVAVLHEHPLLPIAVDDPVRVCVG